MPYKQVSLLLPPGCEVESFEYELGNEVIIQGTYFLPPIQPDYQYSIGNNGNKQTLDNVYLNDELYPKKFSSDLVTQYLNGFSFALGKFTPLRWNPITGRLSYFANVKIIIHTKQSAQSQKALKNLTSSQNALKRVRLLAQNENIIDLYPQKENTGNYNFLIITNSNLKPKFNPLKNFYDSLNIFTRIATTDSILSAVAGNDAADKIRNFIIEQYQDYSIEYVLLGGDVGKVAYRGLYCNVVSGSGYEDNDILADLYFSALDGNFDANGNGIYGEALQDSVDLLPEIAIGRFPVDNVIELNTLVNKTIKYQKYPILTDLNKIILLGEMLLDIPLSLGKDYLELLIDNHSDNGYTTTGIPSATNTIDTLYDRWDTVAEQYIFRWDLPELRPMLNSGSSFIYHVGHSSQLYMMRMSDMELNNTVFNLMNGSDHSYGLLYSHGCLCGSFDFDDCIAEMSLTLNNYLAACIVNSRYGWFNEGQTEGPSQHLNREFVNAIYNPAIKERHIGNAFIMSKIATAPWVDLTGEYEFGAQRWVHYCNNLLGDPVLRMWIDAVEVGVENTEKQYFSVYPNPSEGIVFVDNYFVGKQLQVYNSLGSIVYSEIISDNYIDLKKLDKGLYILKINDAEKFYSSKLILQ